MCCGVCLRFCVYEMIRIIGVFGGVVDGVFFFGDVCVRIGLMYFGECEVFGEFEFL